MKELYAKGYCYMKTEKDNVDDAVDDLIGLCDKVGIDACNMTQDAEIRDEEAKELYVCGYMYMQTDTEELDEAIERLIGVCSSVGIDACNMTYDAELRDVE